MADLTVKVPGSPGNMKSSDPVEFIKAAMVEVQAIEQRVSDLADAATDAAGSVTDIATAAQTAMDTAQAIVDPLTHRRKTFAAINGDFVPGTTLQLVLPSAPAATASLDVHFDAAFQTASAYLVAGNTITFNEPIPLEVEVVDVKWFTAGHSADVSDGSVTTDKYADNSLVDSKVKAGTKLARVVNNEVVLFTDLAAPGAARLVGLKLDDGPNAVPITAQDAARQQVSAIGFNSINAALATGKDVHLSQGTWVVDTITFTTPGQTLYMHGALLKVRTIIVDADYVTINLGGGEIRGDLHVGRLAAQAAVGQNKLVFEDASSFVVGDLIWTSYGDNNVNWPLATPTAITAIAGNTVTVATNLAGAVPIPAGIYIGTFEWSSLVDSRGARRLRFEHGKITNARGYFLYSWRWNQPDFLTRNPSIECEGVDFNGAGLDQFLMVKAKLKLIDCNVGINYDVAKTGFVYGDDAQIELVRGSVKRGNFDSDFTPISDASRSTFFQGSKMSITADGTEFDGANKLPGSAYFNADCLHAVHVGTGGGTYDGASGRPAYAKFGKFAFPRCTFNNYSRSVFSTTVVADPYAVDIDSATFDDATINTQLFHLKSLAYVKIRNFSFNHSLIKSTGAYDFTQTQNAKFVAKLNACTMTLAGTLPYLDSVELNNSIIADSPNVAASGTARFNNAVLQNSSISTSPVFGSAQFTGTFIVDNASFAGSSANLTDMGIMSLQDGQGAGIRVKSVHGSHWYDVGAFAGKAFLAAELSMSWFNAFGPLVGDDWIIGASANIRSAYGAQYKVPYTLPAALAAAAAAAANSITVDSISYPGNRPAAGDKVFIQLSSGNVHVDTVAVGYVDNTTVIPLTTGMPSAAANGAGVWFVRAVAL